MKTSDVFGDLPTLETKRLLLRRFVAEDALAVFEFLSDPEVTRYTPRVPHQSIEETERFLQLMMARYAGQELSRWGIVHKADQKVIGLAGFIDWQIADARAEIAHLLTRKYWGQGYMTEAVRAILAFGFGKMALNRIEALCEPENVGSVRVLEKVGMQFEGLLREYRFDKGTYHTVGMYAILRSEWGSSAPRGGIE